MMNINIQTERNMHLICDDIFGLHLSSLEVRARWTHPCVFRTPPSRVPACLSCTGSVSCWPPAMAVVTPSDPCSTVKLASEFQPATLEYIRNARTLRLHAVRLSPHLYVRPIVKTPLHYNMPRASACWWAAGGVCWWVQGRWSPYPGVHENLID
ncbi:hypothetical protein VUR80DRAFT_5326 [Thermomyces stellatus]